VALLFWKETVLIENWFISIFPSTKVKTEFIVGNFVFKLPFSATANSVVKINIGFAAGLFIIPHFRKCKLYVNNEILMVFLIWQIYKVLYFLRNQPCVPSFSSNIFEFKSGCHSHSNFFIGKSFEKPFLSLSSHNFDLLWSIFHKCATNASFLSHVNDNFNERQLYLLLHPLLKHFPFPNKYMSYLFVNIVFSYKYVCQSILSSEIKLAWVKQQVFLFLQEEYNEKLQFVPS